jgi:vitamin B12 transporter
MPSRNPDDDGYTSESLAARVGLELNASHRLDLSVLSSQLNAQYDSQFGAINVDDRTVKKLQTSALSWRAQWSADYSSTVSVNRSQDRYETLPSPDLTVTNMTGYLFQNEYRRQGHLLTWTMSCQTARPHPGTAAMCRTPWRWAMAGRAAGTRYK